MTTTINADMPSLDAMVMPNSITRENDRCALPAILHARHRSLSFSPFQVRNLMHQLLVQIAHDTNEAPAFVPVALPGASGDAAPVQPDDFELPVAGVHWCSESRGAVTLPVHRECTCEAPSSTLSSTPCGSPANASADLMHALRAVS